MVIVAAPFQSHVPVAESAGETANAAEAFRSVTAVAESVTIGAKDAAAFRSTSIPDADSSVVMTKEAAP
jgi:hypothetical protein